MFYIQHLMSVCTHFTVILMHIWLYNYIFISFIQIIVAFDSSYINTYKATPSSSFYTVCCQRYSDCKSVTGGGHLEFSHEKVDEKKETVFSQFFRVNISGKTKLFKIYMKKSQNMYLLHNSVYYTFSLPKKNEFSKTNLLFFFDTIH